MKKKTKELIGKIVVGITALTGSAFLLFGKKKKEVIDIKKNKDKNLFI